MKYTIETIHPENKFLFFWGHRPSKDGTITQTCFSQWWLRTFIVDEIAYKSAEHWMMARKALLFDDSEIFEKIVLAKTPAEAKKLGRQIKNFEEDIWVKNRFQIVKEGNIHKFTQHTDLKNYLLKSKPRIIVESSPVDAIWGIGMAKDHVDSHNPKKWKGLNLLGFALMEVRDEIG